MKEYNWWREKNYLKVESKYKLMNIKPLETIEQRLEKHKQQGYEPSKDSYGSSSSRILLEKMESK
tara:strand:+ start:162 stop:356 length:195 start_codon:yes stop_codon:yes gene_type:complete